MGVFLHHVLDFSLMSEETPPLARAPVCLLSFCQPPRSHLSPSSFAMVAELPCWHSFQKHVMFQDPSKQLPAFWTPASCLVPPQVQRSACPQSPDGSCIQSSKCPSMPFTTYPPPPALFCIGPSSLRFTI